MQIDNNNQKTQNIPPNQKTNKKPKYQPPEKPFKKILGHLGGSVS